MKPHTHLFHQSDSRSSTAVPLCLRSVEMRGRFAPSRSARGVGRALLSLLLMAWPLILPAIVPGAAAKKLIHSSHAPLVAATIRRHRARHTALLITIVVAGFLWLMVSAETVAVFAQADVANSTVK